MAMVETVTLAVVALVGLAFLQRSEAGRVVTGGGRGVAPTRRRLGGSRWAVAVFGWILAAILLLPHATLVLVSLVPRSTWTVEILPPVLNLSNYAALFSEPERLRPLLPNLRKTPRQPSPLPPSRRSKLTSRRPFRKEPRQESGLPPVL